VLGEVVARLIEAYARHNGRTDVLHESMGGETGEWKP